MNKERMGNGCSRRGLMSLAAAVLLGALMTGCEKGADLSHLTVQTVESPFTGTGTLTVAVADAEGRPVVGASVSVANSAQIGEVLGNAETNTTGVATFGSVPAVAFVSVFHEFGNFFRQGPFDVAQAGGTYLPLTLQAGRPQPTVALLPVSISAGSVNTDRSQLTLEVKVVASASAPFGPSGYSDYSSVATPSMGLKLGPSADADSDWDCFVLLDRTRTVPSCGDFVSSSPYIVSVDYFYHDRVGTAPLLAVPGPARSAMLLMDQSGRVPELDPSARRSFAARAFIARAIASSQPESLSVAGFAGDGSYQGTSASLPVRPLWSPLGTSTVFSADAASLNSAVVILEPYVGGSAPVIDALREAFTLTAAHAPPGTRAVVALLAGSDDGDMPEASRRAALLSLRQQREQAGIQTVLISGLPSAQRSEREAVAELSATLRAPVISMGVTDSWEAGSYAALDFAADLIDGVPLPTLAAVFHVTADQPDAFPAGTMLFGVVYVESEICPFGCWQIPLEFAVEIP